MFSRENENMCSGKNGKYLANEVIAEGVTVPYFELDSSIASNNA